MLNVMMMMVMMILVFEEKEVIFLILNYVNLVYKILENFDDILKNLI